MTDRVSAPRVTKARRRELTLLRCKPCDTCGLRDKLVIERCPICGDKDRVVCDRCARIVLEHV